MEKSLACLEESFPPQSFPLPLCAARFPSLSSSSSLSPALVISSPLFTLRISSSIPSDIYRYLPLVDIFLSQVAISVFPLLNLFPAYVLFCQLFINLVNICTERPAGNQPVGESSLCVNWSRPLCVCVWNCVRQHFNLLMYVCVCVCVCVCWGAWYCRCSGEGSGMNSKFRVKERFSPSSRTKLIRCCFMEPDRNHWLRKMTSFSWEQCFSSTIVTENEREGERQRKNGQGCISILTGGSITI